MWCQASYLYFDRSRLVEKLKKKKKKKMQYFAICGKEKKIFAVVFTNEFF